MPTLRVLSPKEVEAFKKEPVTNVRAQIAAEYDQLLSGMNVGEYATVSLDDGDNKPTVRNRLKSAAQRRNLSIVFHRTHGNDQNVVFHLEETDDATAVFAAAAEQVIA